MNIAEGHMSARLLRVAPEYVIMELTIIDPTISGEIILPFPQFVEFVETQKIKIIQETEDERILGMELAKALEAHHLHWPSF